LLALAGTRIQMHNFRGVHSTLAHMRTRFRGQFPDLEQLSEYFEVAALSGAREFVKAADIVQRLSVNADNMRHRKILECLRYYLQAEILAGCGRAEAGLSYLEKALERLQGETPKRVDLVLQVAIYNCFGQTLSHLERDKESLAYFTRAFTVASHIGLPLMELRIIRNRGMSNVRLGSMDAAEAYLCEALRRSRALCSAYDIVRCDLDLGRVYYRTRQYAKALVLFREAQAQCGTGRYSIEEAEINSRIGDILVTEGRFSDASRYYDADYELAVESGSLYSRGHALKNVGRVQRLLGNYEKSAEKLSEAYEVFSRLNDYREIVSVLFQLSLCYAVAGKIEKAREVAAEYRRYIEMKEVPLHEGWLQMLEGIIMRREGKLEEAAFMLEEALAIFREDPGFYALFCLLELAQLYADCGQKEKSLQYFRDTILLARQVRMYDIEKQALAYLANVDRAEWSSLLYDHSRALADKNALSRQYAGAVMLECRTGDDFASLDLEEAGAVLDKFFDIVTESVSGTDGLISRIMGTRALIVFGIDGSFDAGKAFACACKAVSETMKLADTKAGAGITAAAAITAGTLLSGSFGPLEHRSHGFFGKPLDIAHAILSSSDNGEVLLSHAALQGIPAQMIEPEMRDIPVFGQMMPVYSVKLGDNP
ncbi:MAG: hypothetical protein K6G50_07095, partial [bacterium]|nr:hypothetical protein [bacterium]